MSAKIYVRLKPVNKRKGYVCRRFVWHGQLFRAGEWKKVPGIVAEQLAKLIQPRSEDMPKPLFDIGKDEAEAVEIRKQDEPEKSVDPDGAIEVELDSFRGLAQEQEEAEKEAEPVGDEQPKRRRKPRAKQAPDEEPAQ